jgi:mono/diheme cytochrome c family protein
MGRINLMKKVTAAVIISAISILFINSAEAIHTGWFAPDETNKLKNSHTSSPEAAVAGKKIYEQHCLKCHGPGGKGDGASAGSLQIELPDFSNKEVTAEETDGEWFWKIRTGLFEMPPFQIILKDDEVWKVIVYVRTLAK